MPSSHTGLDTTFHILDNVPELAWSTLPDGHLDYCNRRWLEYTGMTLEEAKGWGWRKACRVDALPGVIERWQRSLASGDAFELEIPLRRSDGAFRWFLVRARALRDEEGKIVRWFGTNTDIDELKRLRVRQGLLLAANEAFASGELQDGLHRLASIALPEFADGCSVYLRAASGALERVAVAHVDPKKAQMIRDAEAGLGAASAERNGALQLLTSASDSDYVTYANSPEQLALIRAVRPLSSIRVPILIDGECAGVLVFLITEPGRAFDEEDLRVAQAVAERAALGIQATRINRECGQILQRFELATSAFVGLVYDVDVRSGHVWRSGSLAKVLGLEHSEFAPTSPAWFALLHPEDAAAIRPKYEQIRSDPRISRWSWEYRLRRKDGSFAAVQDNVLLVRDERGEVTRILGVAIDVSERKAQEQALRVALRKAEESQAVFDAFFMTAPLGLALYDRDIRFQRINDHLARMNGVPVEDHIGKHPCDVVPGLPQDFIETHSRAVLESGVAARDVEMVGYTPAAPGIKRTWLEHFFPVKVGGEAIGVGVIVEEITAKKRSDEARKDLLASERQARGEAERAVKFAELFIAILGHDLRNPLSAIMTAGTLLLRTAHDDLQKRTAGRVITSGQRMSRMIDQILDVTRIRAGKGLPFKLVPMDLGALLTSVRDELSSTSKPVRVEVVGATEGTWDADRLAQVFSNLLGNAVEHSPTGTIVAVKVDGRSPDGVEVTVKNHGVIAPDVVPSVFEPFRGSRQSKKARGLGLGLYITKEIVMSHGGTIDVTSTSGSGTCFKVTLPRAPAPPASTRLESAVQR